MPFWLRILLRFDGGIRTDVLRRLIDAGWVDAYRHLHPDKAGFTLPPGRPSVRLDYVLVPAGLLPRIDRCEPADGPLVERASDHLPLLIDVRGPDTRRRRAAGMTDDRETWRTLEVPGGGPRSATPRHAERSAGQRR